MESGAQLFAARAMLALSALLGIQPVLTGFDCRTQVPSLPRHEGCCPLVAGKSQAACRAR